MSLLPNLDQMTDNEKLAVLESIQKSIAESKEIQKKKIGENVDLVVQALKKIESDIRDRFDAVGNSIEKRVLSIQDGRDGANGTDGRNGKDGKSGRDGLKGDRGVDGQAGRDGIDGVDGISVVNAQIDFDGSLVITLSDGRELNVGEVVSADVAEKINIISTMSTNAAIAILDEGTSITSGVKKINFVGAAVTATNSGDDVTVNVSAGTVTSVTGTSPVASSGGATPAISLSAGYGDTLNPYASKTANFVLAAPNGSAGVPTFRAVVAADIPTLNQNTTGTASNVTGTVAVIRGGTAQTSYTNGQLLIGNTTGNTLTKATLSAGTGISITNGTGSISIASTVTGTVTSVAATSGTGISITGSPITTSGTLNITNTAPDQTVALTQGGTTTITGTYPNFTISSADQFQGTVTSVTGTSPVVSSGGATPAISLSAGYGDTLNPYASKTANFVLAAPNGSAGVPTFRAIVAADIPTLNQNTTGTASNVTGTVAVANGGTGLTTVPHTVQVFTSGSGTYTTPANCKAIQVMLVGGGGGGSSGGSASNNSGTAGGNTTFGTSLLTGAGGAGGVNNAGTTAQGGAGTVSSPAAGIGLSGGNATGGGYGASGVIVNGGAGGNSAFGGGAGCNINTAGGTAQTNTGGGGAGGGGGAVAGVIGGTGGGAGGYVNALITSPSATYSYAVGAGGSGGGAGTNGQAGGAGGSGVIYVMEFYV